MFPKGKALPQATAKAGAAKKSGMKKAVTPAQAKALASFLKNKKSAPRKTAPVDAEDKLDGGIDEATEED